MIRRVDVICASACCRGIYFNQIKVQLILIYKSSTPRGGLLFVFLGPPQKKSKISLPTCHRWERAHPTFSENTSGILSCLVRALS